MIEESGSLQQKEKAQSHLYSLYKRAMSFLKTGQFQNGKSQLQNIIRSPYIDEYQMRKLKKSALLSLGNMMSSMQKYQLTLGYYYAAFQVQQALRQQMEENFNPNTTSSLQYNILLKMYLLTQKLSCHQQSIYLLKKTLRVCPLLWRSKILNQLMRKYENLKMVAQLKDMKLTLANPQKLNSILNQKQNPNQKLSNPLIINNQLQAALNSRIHKKHLPSIKIYVQDHNYNYSIFQYLMTVSYVLLKCQSRRNFNSKRYLKKKYEASNIEWNNFLAEYHPTRTKIQLIYVKNKQQQQMVQLSDQIEEDSDKPQNQIEQQGKQSQNSNQNKVQKKQYHQMVEELSKQLLRIRYTKKKKTKNQIAQQVVQAPVVAIPQGKSSKKNQLQKSSFQSLKSFFNQILQKNHFKKSQLEAIKCLNQTIFDKLFSKLIAQYKTPSMEEGQQLLNGKDKQQKNKNQQRQGKQTKIKKPLKQKKQLQQQKLEHFNNLFLKFLKNMQRQPIDESSDNISHTFINICDFFKRINMFILDQKNSDQINNIIGDQNQHLKIWKQKSLRLLIGKNTLKITPSYGGYLQSYYPRTQKKLQQQDVEYFSILVQYFQYMCKKPQKQTQFSTYQTSKIQFLKCHIRQNWQISIKLLSKENNKIFKNAKIIAIWSKMFVIFYAIKENVEINKLNYYKQLALHYNKTCKQLLKTLNYERNTDFLNDTCEFSIETLIKQRFQDLTDKRVQIKPINPVDVQVQIIFKALQQNMFSHDFFSKINSIFQIYFKKLEQKTEEFTYKFMDFITQKMKIQQIIQKVYKKFTEITSGIIACFQKTSQNVKEETLFYFIKINLLGSLQSNQDILRIVFFLTNFIMKSNLQNQKHSFINTCKIIIFYHQLILLSEKRQKIQKRDVIMKKFYQNIISKNLNKIYYQSFQDWKNKQKQRQKVLNKNYALRLSQNQQKQAAQKLKKQLLAQQGQNSSLQMQIQQTIRKISSKKQIQPETILKYELQDKVIDIINQIYFNSDFSPKKIQDSIGFFIFLSRNYSKQFQCEEVQLETAVIKVFKKCYKIFQDRRGQILTYCPKFKSFQQRMEKVWNGQQKQIQEFITIIKDKIKICECCCNQQLQQKYHYKEILYILARFFQTNPYTPDEQKDKDSNKSMQYTKLDEQFYKEYLLLDLSNPNTQKAWINFIRSSSLKSYLYFDSLILLQPIEALKNKFLYTKRIINFLKQSIINEKNKSNFENLKIFTQRTMNILNLLKIKERQYFMILKSIQTKRNVKQTKQYVKKYYEGIRTILHKYSNADGITSTFLGITELKIKDLKYNQWSKQKIQKTKVFVGQVHYIVSKLEYYEKQKEEVCIHLEEDLVVESYIFLLKTLEQFIQKFISKAAQKKLTQINFGQVLEYLNFLSDRNILGNSQKYKPKFLLQNKTLNLNNNQIQIEVQPIQINEYKNQQKVDEKENKIDLIQNNVIDLIDEEVKDSNSNQNDSEQLKQNKGPFNFKPLNQKIQQKKQSQKSKVIQKINVLSYIQLSIAKLKSVQKVDSKYADLFDKINSVFNGIINMLKSLPKFQLKRFKYRRSVTNALLYCSQVYLKFSLKVQTSFEIIKDYYNIRSDDIVFVFTHFQRKSTQKNQYLSEFYNRGLVHNIQRLKFIQHLIQLFSKSLNIESLIILIRKLNKIMTNNAGQEEGKEVRYLLMLYWQAVDKYIQILQKWCIQKQIDQRYEKLCIQFKNRIKKSISFQKQKQKQKTTQKDKEKQKLVSVQQNPYLFRIQKFIKDYEAKYTKKIKMKKAKKQKVQKQIKQRQKELLDEGFLKNQNMMKGASKKEKKIQKKLQKEKPVQITQNQEKQPDGSLNSSAPKCTDINLEVVIQIDNSQSEQNAQQDSGKKKIKGEIGQKDN